MKTYVLTISKNFPSTHSKKGTPTNFFYKIKSGDKKHTIRANYELWKKRIDEVNEGKAIISLRTHSAFFLLLLTFARHFRVENKRKKENPLNRRLSVMNSPDLMERQFPGD